MYNTKGVLEHLRDTDIYQRRSEKEAVDKNNILRYRINVFISKWRDMISPAEYRFLYEAMDKHKCTLAKFCMSLKTQKTP